MLILKNRLIMAVLALAHIASIGVTLLRYSFIRIPVRRVQRK
jgi:hypothetical protein